MGKTQKTKKAASLLQLTACVFCGAPEEIRTPGLQVRSLLLYPAELRARCEKLCIAIALSCQILSRKKSFFCAKAAACLPASGMAEGARQSLSPHSLPPGREQHSRPGQRICPTKNGAAIDGSNVPAAPPRDRPGSQSHRLRRQDDRNVFLMRGSAAPLHHRHRPHTAKNTFQI